MTNIISIVKQDIPADHCRLMDHFTGKEMGLFGIEYTMPDGSRFSLTLWADDWADAELRLNMLATNGKVFGQIYDSGPFDDDPTPKRKVA